VRAPVEDAGDAPEGLLARGVPDLQLHYLILNLRDKCAEFNPNSDLMLYLKVIIHDSRQQAALAHIYIIATLEVILTCITDDDEFIEEVLIGYVLVLNH
jgi:hypothetical protein